MSRESLLDAMTVVRDVPAMGAAETLARCFDVIHASLLPHFPGREVRVSTSTVELRDRLRVEFRNDAMLLTDSIEEPSREDEMVSDRDSVGSPDLEFPLPGHHLGIDTADSETRIKAGSHVFLNELTTEDLIRANAAVEGSLLGWVTTCRPTEGLADLEESVLLLDSEERLVIERLRDNVT